LGEDRSIVTDIPGTTRDWIEALAAVEGIPLRLADTAGLRETGGREAAGRADPVEQMGIQKSRELLEQADLVLYVIDGERGLQDGEEALLRTLAGTERPAPLMLLWNKADIAPLGDVPRPGGAILLPVSAKTGRGLAELRGAIAASLEGGNGRGPEAGPPEPAAGLGSGRQKELVDRAAAALAEALELADRGETLDLAAPLLREAVNALGEITGEVSTADILETIFSKFCVGK
jgi:tRNA modification GTPase